MKSGSTTQLNFGLIKNLYLKSVDLFSHSMSTFPEARLPQNIAEFTLLQEFFPHGDANHRSFRYGIYSSKNKEAIAKIWTGTRKNFDFYSLVNELQFYETLHVLRRNKTLSNLLQKYKINFPQLYFVKREKHQLIMLIEKIEGDLLKTKTLSLQVQTVERVMSFLQEFSRLYSNDLKSISNRSVTFTMLVNFFSIVKIAFSKPKQLLPALNIFFQTIWVYFFVVFSTKKSLTHRSLELQNIIVKNSTAYIIDFQLIAFSHPVSELVQTLFFSWDNQKFCSNLLTDKKIEGQIQTTEGRQAFCFYAFSTVLLQLAEGVVDDTTTISFLKGIQQYIRKPRQSLYEFIISQVHKFLLLVQPFIKESRNQKIILCYHSISDSSWRFATPPKIFENHLQKLKEKYDIVPLKTLLESDFHTQKSQVAITLDDGYQDNLRIAVPIFKKFDIVPTLFMIANSTKVNRREVANTLPLLSDNELRALVRNGWEIGCHTSTHAYLNTTDSTILKEEINDSKKTLEKKIGKTIDVFSYPRGYYNSQVIQKVRSANFKYAFTVNGGIVNKTNRFTISRIPIEGKVSADELLIQLSSVGMMIDSFFLKLLQMKESLISKKL